MNTSCSVADLSWWHWGCSISAHWIVSANFWTSLGVKWGLSRTLSHTGSASPCHSWFLCTGGSHRRKDVNESGGCSYQCHLCKGGTFVAQAQYLEIHLTVLKLVLTSLHLVLLALDDQLARLQSSPQVTLYYTYQHGSLYLVCFMSILVFNILLLKYLDFHIMTCLFSKWVVNNYGHGGMRAGWNSGCLKYFGEPKRF